MAANTQAFRAGDRAPDLVEADSEPPLLVSTLDELPRSTADSFEEQHEDNEAFTDDGPVRTLRIYGIRSVLDSQFEHTSEEMPHDVIVAWEATDEEDDAQTDASQEGTDGDNEEDIELDVDDEERRRPVTGTFDFHVLPPAQPWRGPVRTPPDVLARVRVLQPAVAAGGGLALLRAERAPLRAGAAMDGRLPPIHQAIVPPIAPPALPAQHRGPARRHARLLRVAQREVEERRRPTESLTLIEKLHEVQERPPASPDPYAGSHFAGGAVLSARQLRRARGHDERGAGAPEAPTAAAAQGTEQEQMGGTPPRPAGARPVNLPTRRMFGSEPTPRRTTL